MPQTSTAQSSRPAPEPAPLRGAAAPERPPLRLVAGTDRGGVAQAPGSVLRRSAVGAHLSRLGAVATRWLTAHSLLALRLSVGAVFLAFGALKLFPGVSPAESLVSETTRILSFGLMPAGPAVLAVGVLECIVGACLLTGRALRGAICILATLLVGILSPLVLLAPRLFSGPHHAPTLEGQYVIKDLIVVTATLVIAAHVAGASLHDGERSPSRRRLTACGRRARPL